MTRPSGDMEVGDIEIREEISECKYESNPMKWLKSFSKSGGKIVHLTMYGTPLE